MKFTQSILVICLLSLFQATSFAQYLLPSFQSQTIDNNQFLVRWEPRTAEEWQASLVQGYQVKIYKGTNTNNLMLASTDNIKPISIPEWDRAITQVKDSLLNSFYQGSKTFLYMEQEVQNELMESLSKEEGKTLQQTVDEFRLGYLVYSITFDFDLIKKAGLGYSVALEEGYVYRLEVQVGSYPSYTFDYGARKRNTLGVPDLNAEFGDEKVTVDWRTPEFKEQFFGYYLAISDDGKRYTNVSPMPYVNILDTIQGEPKLQSITEEIQLPRNYKNYWLRLKGMNYFGIESRRSSTEKGYGYEVIDVMPIVNHADQTEDNFADIKWTLDTKYNRLVDHFEIYRADSLEGEYVSVYDSIPTNHRSVRLPMEQTRNYFSVAIIPKDGPVIRSFAVFVMGQDTLPPVIPQNFGGQVDSLGIVTLTWNQNRESDLWGYKIFRSEFANDEFSSMHDSPFRDTFFVDTLNLNSINEKIHYSIIALDKRNNRSDFSAMISLVRPDTIPPTPPLIRKVSFLEDSIKITWATSSSHDVMKHQLFRKELNEDGWKLLAEQQPTEDISYFIDRTFSYDKIYVYTAIAHDDANLKSRPSRPYKVQTISKKPKEAFVGFEVNFDEKSQTSTIRWDLKDANKMEEVIVYRGLSKDDISMYQILEPTDNKISQKIEGEEQWYFMFKPIFNDGTLSKMSELVLVENPK